MELMTAGELMAAGAQIRALLDASGVAAYEYEPGNGTRFELLFCEVPEFVLPARSDRMAHVGSPGRTAVSLLNFRRCYHFGLGGEGLACEPSYIAEKLFDGKWSDDAFMLQALFTAIINAGHSHGSEHVEKVLERRSARGL